MFLIVSGGDAPSPEFLKSRAERAVKIIAADRGAEYCLQAGVRPDFVVGDMDSLSRAALGRVQSSGVTLVRHSREKDETDTELALDLAIDQGAVEVEMLACTGNRFDHTLANIHLLRAARRRGVEAWILSESFKIFLVDSCARLDGMEGATLSLLPLSLEVKGIQLTGFRWDLSDASMEVGSPCGVSNRVVSPEAVIRVEEGMLVAELFFPSKRQAGNG